MTLLATSDVVSTSSPPGLLMTQQPLGHKLTLLSGAGALLKGTLLGKITRGAATAAAKGGGNTGNGTFVIDATTPTLARSILGIYTLRVIEVHAVHDYTVELNDPNGMSVGSFRLTGTGASITIAEQIKGVLTDGSTDFIVGDGFDITVPAGSGKLLKSLAAAVDGSEEPDSILAEDADATSADAQALCYERCDWAEAQLILGTGHTVASVREGLRKKGINIVSTGGN